VDYELEWAAWDAYEIVHPTSGTITFVPCGKVRRVYSPADSPALVSSFAHLYHRLATWDEFFARCLDFLPRFGLLGESQFNGSELEFASGVQWLAHDTFPWLLRHASLVELVVRLKIAQQDGDHDRLTRILSQVGSDVSKCKPLIGGVFEKVPEPFDYKRLADRGLLPHDMADQLIARILEVNLVGVRRGVPSRNGRDVFHFKAPIQLIYWRLNDYLGRYAIKLCQGCERPFFAMDARQRFCPPPPGIKESRCAAKRRVAHARATSPGRVVSETKDVGDIHG
jgi:hypothetical protein